MSKDLLNRGVTPIPPWLHSCGLFPKPAFYLKNKGSTLVSGSFQYHTNMFQFRFIQNFENQSPRVLQGRCIHMYDLINEEAEIPCIQKAPSQRWLLAGIDFFVLLR